jgi:hypothetical protein
MVIGVMILKRIRVSIIALKCEIEPLRIYVNEMLTFKKIYKLY